MLLFQINLCKNLLAQSEANIIAVDSTEQQIPAKDILKGTSPQAKLFTARKINFILNTASSFSSLFSDTSMVFQLTSRPPALFLTPEELLEITPQGADPFGDELRRRYNDIPPTIPLNQLIRSLAKNNKSSRKKFSGPEIPIPTDLEIDILKVLWVQPVITSSDIYAKMDTQQPITSEDLNKILEHMTHRGFLDSKKISPSHEFGLFGFAKIELSRKNVKNQLYIYWPLIPKDKLITYLDAKRFLAYEAAQISRDDGQSNQFYKALAEKLNRVVRQN